MEEDKIINNDIEKSPNSAEIVKSELFDENGRFKVGHPKIGGKQKGYKAFTTMIDEIMDCNIERDGESTGKTYRDVIGKKVVKLMMEGNEQILKHYWDHKDGKAKQTNEIEIQTEKELFDEIADAVTVIKKLQGEYE